MRIGIDISQLAYQKTGVANFLLHLLIQMFAQDKENEYILFYASMRRNFQMSMLHLDTLPKNVHIKTFKLPPTALDMLWNRLHIAPIEWFIGDIDVFISSDWTQPPTKKAKAVTILYDLIVYKYPDETAQKIVATQKRRLQWVKKECDAILCISQATKKDAKEVLGIDEKKLHVIYPGI